MESLVSVICLCYNHEKFVKEALLSVFNQSYARIEVLVVDDCSSDGSVSVIREILKDYPSVRFIENKVNLGNCRSFNKAFSLSKGDFVVDFACDDVMMSDRIAEQVQVFNELNDSYGVVYTNAENIDEKGIFINFNYPKNSNQPSGYIYMDLVERYFISPPTMMMKREVLEYLGGYDESLAYEDFDFWIRSSRRYQYYFLNKILTKRRVVLHSHSSKFNWEGNNPFIASTYKVVMKAAWLNKKEEENAALIKRVKYEFRHAGYIANNEFSKKYFLLLKQLGGANVVSYVILALSELNLPLPLFYRFLKKIRN